MSVGIGGQPLEYIAISQKLFQVNKQFAGFSDKLLAVAFSVVTLFIIAESVIEPVCGRARDVTEMFVESVFISVISGFRQLIDG